MTCFCRRPGAGHPEGRVPLPAWPHYVPPRLRLPSVQHPKRAEVRTCNMHFASRDEGPEDHTAGLHSHLAEGSSWHQKPESWRMQQQQIWSSKLPLLAPCPTHQQACGARRPWTPLAAAKQGSKVRTQVAARLCHRHVILPKPDRPCALVCRLRSQGRGKQASQGMALTLSLATARMAQCSSRSSSSSSAQCPASMPLRVSCMQPLHALKQDA